jgi:hypothetical protein
MFTECFFSSQVEKGHFAELESILSRLPEVQNSLHVQKEKQVGNKINANAICSQVVEN